MLIVFLWCQIVIGLLIISSSTIIATFFLFSIPTLNIYSSLSYVCSLKHWNFFCAVDLYKFHHLFDCIVFLSWSQIEVPSTLGWLPTTFCFSSLFSPQSPYYSFLSKRNLTALYLPLVSHWLTKCHFKIWTQRNDFGDLRPFRLLIRVMSGQKTKLLRCFLFLALKMK